MTRNDGAVPSDSRDREQAGSRGAVLWLTGLPGSGKTTLALALEARLKRDGMAVSVIDGDGLRRGLSQDLGYSEADRRENNRRAAELALHLAEAGLTVIVALISPHRQSRDAAAARIRAAGISFAEIFVNAPLATCERRDPKGLYRRARLGEVPAFTGVTAPYEIPVAPRLELRTDVETVAACLEKLATLAADLNRSTGKS